MERRRTSPDKVDVNREAIIGKMVAVLPKLPTWLLEAVYDMVRKMAKRPSSGEPSSGDKLSGSQRRKGR